ncbi:hypothetical protein K2X33_15095 [bacterium]|nr:hypothetical protein [bacterium]
MKSLVAALAVLVSTVTVAQFPSSRRTSGMAAVASQTLSENPSNAGFDPDTNYTWSHLESGAVSLKFTIRNREVLALDGALFARVSIQAFGVDAKEVSLPLEISDANEAILRVTDLSPAKAYRLKVQLYRMPEQGLKRGEHLLDIPGVSYALTIPEGDNTRGAFIAARAFMELQVWAQSAKAGSQRPYYRSTWGFAFPQWLAAQEGRELTSSPVSQVRHPGELQLGDIVRVGSSVSPGQNYAVVVGTEDEAVWVVEGNFNNALHLHRRDFRSVQGAYQAEFLRKFQPKEPKRNGKEARAARGDLYET